MLFNILKKEKFLLKDLLLHYDIFKYNYLDTFKFRRNLNLLKNFYSIVIFVIMII